MAGACRSLQKNTVVIEEFIGLDGPTASINESTGTSMQ